MRLGERLKRKVFAQQYARNAERLRISRCVRDRHKVQVGFIPGMTNFKIICHQDVQSCATFFHPRRIPTDGRGRPEGREGE